MQDVCNFIPAKRHPGELEFIHFVYETGIKRLRQPFSHYYYRMFLVFKGTARLKTGEKSFPLKRGDVFFTFPDQNYEIDYNEDFCYFYISFGGAGAAYLLENQGISKENCHFVAPQKVVDFWVDSVRSVNQSNANTLTESVLMYTLSYIEISAGKDKPKEKFEIIVDYVNHNFTSCDLSLSKVSDVFYYSEKHLSHLFVNKTGVKFSRYVNDLRIQYAQKLMKNGNKNIAGIANKCGFSDRFYFSKSFKKHTGLTPTEFIAQWEQESP